MVLVWWFSGASTLCSRKWPYNLYLTLDGLPKECSVCPGILVFSIKAFLDFPSLSSGAVLFSTSNTGLVASQSSSGSVDVQLHELQAHRIEQIMRHLFIFLTFLHWQQNMKRFRLITSLYTTMQFSLSANWP